MATFESSLKPRLIYVFAIADKQHEGSLKIGETTLGDDTGAALAAPNSDVLNQAAKARIDQYTKQQVSATNSCTPSLPFTSEEGRFAPSMTNKCIMS